MTGPRWFLLACVLVFVVACRYRISRAFPRGPGSLAAGKGDTTRAVLYSLTGAMMPWKKETAHRHIFSYLLGIGYHAGILLAFLWLIAVFFSIQLPSAAASGSVGLLALAALCGLILLVKRIVTPAMRYFSNPDDYFSNVLVTGFLAMASASLVYDRLTPWFFVYAGVVLLYIPVGKLRHAIYFGLARIYLGLFYGRRGVWPARGGKSWQG